MGIFVTRPYSHDPLSIISNEKTFLQDLFNNSEGTVVCRECLDMDTTTKKHIRNYALNFHSPFAMGNTLYFDQLLGFIKMFL